MNEAAYRELYQELFRIPPTVGAETRKFLEEVSRISIGNEVAGDFMLREALIRLAKSFIAQKRRRGAEGLTPGIIEVQAAFWERWREEKAAYEAGRNRLGAVCAKCFGAGQVCVGQRRDGKIFVIGVDSFAEFSGLVAVPCPYCRNYKSAQSKRLVADNSGHINEEQLLLKRIRGEEA